MFKLAPDVLNSSTFLTRRAINSLPRWYKSRVPDHSTRAILTLDPAKLGSKGQTIYDISSVTTLLIKFQTTGGASQSSFRYHRAARGDGTFQDIRFPAQSRGVFYYHLDPHLPPASGGVRFRLCDSLETFDKGQDLQTTPRKLWEVPLLRIAHASRFNDLAQFLIEDGMVETNVVQDLRKLEPPSRFVGLYLYHLSQPLVIDFGTTRLMVHLVTRKSYSSILFFSPFYSSQIGNPYSGLAKVRFELSTLREHEKKGPTLVLRILEFLSPVQRVLPRASGPYIKPVANSLAMRRTASGILKPWTYPLCQRVDGAKWKEFLSASN